MIFFCETLNAIFFSVNCERAYLLIVKRDLDPSPPPLPPSTFNNDHHKFLHMIEILIK